MAIHCEPESEPHRLYASPEARWIAASDYRLPRNDTALGTGHSPVFSQPVPCHREPERHGDPLAPGNRSALSLRIVIARAEPVAIHCEPGSEHPNIETHLFKRANWITNLGLFRL